MATTSNRNALQEHSMNSRNPFNGLRTYIVKETGAVYIPLPKEHWGQSDWTDTGKCTCGKCDGSGQWDTLVIPGHNDKSGSTFTIHFPELQTGKLPQWFKEKIA